MDTNPFQETALTWYSYNPVKRFEKLSNSILFQILYNSYCCVVGNSRIFEATMQEAEIANRVKEMYQWYEEKYTSLNLDKGTKGQTRYVTGAEKEYTFSRLYARKVFEKYLGEDTPRSGDQKLFQFILHMAVAFMVPPTELDSALQKLGFHPLHVRNIHHLAIYAVLSSIQDHKDRISGDYNPFHEVEALYTKARNILEDTEAPPAGNGEIFNFENKDSMFIRENLFLSNAISNSNFEDLIRINKASLNMRHSLILSDYHKLLAVYANLFEKKSEEYAYSIYNFYNCFSHQITHKKFKEFTENQIDSNGKHPTRQFFILLNLYDYCFAFVGGVPVSKKRFQTIQNNLNRYNVEWGKKARDFYSKDGFFDAYGFIHADAKRQVPEAFDGANFIAEINAKLLVQYGWGQLNPRLPFDYYLSQLAFLTINLNRNYSQCNCGIIEWNKIELAKYYACTDVAPRPLAVIIKIFHHLKTVIAGEIEKKTGQKNTSISPYPLDCSIYEQL